jgi:hypothetical protein
MNSAELHAEHERCRADSILSFNSAKKMGGHELAEHFRGKLEEDIQVYMGGIWDGRVISYKFNDA